MRALRLGLACLALAGCERWTDLFADPPSLASRPSAVYLVHAQDRFACSSHSEIELVLPRPAEVVVSVTRPGGGAEPQPVLTESLAAGTHRLEAPLEGFKPGDDPGYRIEVRFAGGSKPVVLEGPFAPGYRRDDHVPIAQLVLHDVMVWDGHVRMEENDLGPSAEGAPSTTRWYVSTAGDRFGSLGPGWTNSLETRIREMCGYYVMTSGPDTRWFTREANGKFRTPSGFNSRLVEDGEDLVFYSLDGTEYRFRRLQGASWQLVLARTPGEDPHAYRYEVVGGRPRLVEVKSATSRLTLAYEVRESFRGDGVRMTELRQEGGKRALYSYTRTGELSSVRIEPPAGEATQLSYRYAERGNMTVLDDIQRSPPGDELFYRAFEWEGATLPVDVGGRRIEIPMQRVVLERMNDQYDYTFKYERLSGADGALVRTTVTRPGGVPVVGTLDATVGFTLEWRSEKGVRKETWDRATRRQLSVIQADGTEFRYAYDGYGNQTKIETDRTLSLYTFHPPETFDPPYVANRMRDRDDEYGRKKYHYDRHGRLQSVEVLAGPPPKGARPAAR